MTKVTAVRALLLFKLLSQLKRKEKGHYLPGGHQNSALLLDWPADTNLFIWKSNEMQKTIFILDTCFG